MDLFVQRHQNLMYNVARLALVRNTYEQAKKNYTNGRISLGQLSVDRINYEQVVQRIRSIVADM